MNILEEANKITSKDRHNDYGGPEENFTLVAKYWSVYKGVEFKPEDVGMFNILQKIARQQFKNKRDNLVDIAGYARTLEMLNEAVDK
jgi:hypothetical protein